MIMDARPVPTRKADMTEVRNGEPTAPSRNAVLQRDLIMMKRSEAALRRFSRTPAGRRCLHGI